MTFNAQYTLETGAAKKRKKFTAQIIKSERLSRNNDEPHDSMFVERPKIGNLSEPFITWS